MAKTTEDSKTASKVKGKQKRIAEATLKKSEKKTSPELPAKGKSNISNLNKCCTCAHYPAHFRGCAQPCKIKKAYVARKCDACSSYKCKYQ